MLSLKKDNNSKKSSRLKLKEHQKKIIEYFDKNDHLDRVFLFHSIGSGKTISSLSLAYFYKIKGNNKNKILIACPVSLIENFKKEINKLKLDENQFELITYKRLTNILVNENNYLKDRIVIFDEIHNYRNPNKTTSLLVNSAFNAYKVIMLSATPIINFQNDFATVVAILNKVSYSKAQFNLNNPNFLKNRISCYSMSKDELTKFFPRTKKHLIKIEMTQEYYIQYMNVEMNETDKLPANYKDKDYTAFLNGLRRSSNKIHEISPKYQWILEHYLSNPQKTLIYSFWKDSGIEIIRDILNKAKISNEIIDGSLSAKQRENIIEKYNENKIKVLLITSAASEGINLKETRQVIVLEPHWNNEKLNQVVGRAIRYNSHKDLTESKKQVDVYYLLLVKPKVKLINYILNPFKIIEKTSIDEIMYNLSNSKEKLAEEYLEKLKKYCIENKKI